MVCRMSDSHIVPPPVVVQTIVQEKPLLNRTLRALLGLGVMSFCMSIVVGLLYNGSPTNSLHESAMSWAWAIILLMVMAFGLGNAVEAAINVYNAVKRA